MKENLAPSTASISLCLLPSLVKSPPPPRLQPIKVATSSTTLPRPVATATKSVTHVPAPVRPVASTSQASHASLPALVSEPPTTTKKRS